MIQFRDCPVVDRIRFDSDKFILLVNCPGFEAEPGQFIEIKPSEGSDPLIRRPYSIANIEGDIIWLIIQIRGMGSRLIASSDKINFFGPLGKGFPVKKDVILVGGGSGIAPLFFYGRKYPQNIKKVIFGFKTYPEFDLKPYFPGLVIVTEDGSSEFRGLVTDFVENNGTVFACGPTPMFRALLEKLSPDKLYLSLESYMGCGTGICMGCAVKKSGGKGYFRVCVDGPVFRADRIEL